MAKNGFALFSRKIRNFHSGIQMKWNCVLFSGVQNNCLQCFSHVSTIQKFLGPLVLLYYVVLPKFIEMDFGMKCFCPASPFTRKCSFTQWLLMSYVFCWACWKASSKALCKELRLQAQALKTNILATYNPVIHPLVLYKALYFTDTPKMKH